MVHGERIVVNHRRFALAFETRLMDREVTSKELMELAGVTGVNTLRQWVVRGLIPEPTIRKHPSGRGTISCWPEWVKMRIIQIRELREAGKAKLTDEILLKQDWESVQREYSRYAKRRYTFAQATVEAERNNARMAMAECIWTRAHETAKELADNFGDHHWTLEPRHIDAAIELLKQGVQPVAIIVGDELHVAADVAVSVHLAKRRNPNESFLVIPLAETILSEIPSLVPLTKEASIEPSKTVLRRSGELTSQIYVKAGKNWQVKFGPFKRPRSTDNKAK